MSISAEYLEGNRELIIRPGEEFNSECRADLKAMFTEYDPRVNCIFDFSATTYVDSSGIGLLIALRQQLGGLEARISLINCGPTVMDTFLLAGLQSLFSISRQSPQAS